MAYMTSPAISPVIQACINIAESTGISVGDAVAPDCPKPYCVVGVVSSPRYSGPLNSPEADSADPLDALLSDDGLPTALRSWGQVYDFSLAPHAFQPRLLVPRLTATTTLWGHGKLNVRRAPDDVVIHACQPIVSQGAARQLLRECRDEPKHAVGLVVRRLNIDGDELLLLRDMLTEQSNCFSLWTTAYSTRIERIERQRFAVLQVDEEGVSRPTEFVY